MHLNIPPVGNPVDWQHRRPPPMLVGGSECCLFLNSGTAALAVALLAAKSAATSTRPEVIIPGYACPDLVSAAVYAGVTPVAVDLEPERPYLSPEAVERAVTADTVAIVAVNFLGIPERIEALRAVADRHHLTLVEDSAQFFSDKGLPLTEVYSGDLVVLSFGKGKPVNLLGGGCLLVKNTALIDHLPGMDVHPGLRQSPGFIGRLTTAGLLIIYNRLITRRWYWCLKLLPFIKIGATEYKTLEAIAPMDPARLELLAGNISRYQKRDDAVQLKIDTSLNRLPTIINLPRVCRTYSGQRLLRYPILAKDNASRDKLLARLEKAGTGASPFYPDILPNMPGVAPLLKGDKDLPNAAAFAGRLITLATHRGVTHSLLREINRILGET